MVEKFLTTNKPRLAVMILLQCVNQFEIFSESQTLHTIKQIEEILVHDEVFKRIPYGLELYLQHLRNKSEIVLNLYKDTSIKE